MSVISKAPGRVCLFGDHQDYLGLPVISCAIDRYVTISGTQSPSDFFTINLPNLGTCVDVRFRESTPTPHTTHLIDALTVVGRYGCKPNVGYDLTIMSDVPINAGLSSSSAVVVAWVQWLLHTFGCDREITPRFVGQLAYEAEVLEKGASGGKMDQYTSAIGGTMYLETDDASRVLNLDGEALNLIIGESGVPKDTEGLLGDLKGNQQEVLEKVKKLDDAFDIHTATAADFEKFKSFLSEEQQRFFYASIHNCLITQRALRCFPSFANTSVGRRESELNFKEIGRLMNEHHYILKNYLRITVPVIDTMITAALDAGALGAKIVGSGGGGSMVAISPKGRENQIITALGDAGAAASYHVNVAKGAHIL